MKLVRTRCAVALALFLPTIVANAQSWRSATADLGATARVLIIGARPEDEDNALIAWLSLGKHVETAYLSLTRGESAMNAAGTERQSALGVVRTAELLAERERDGAHQYFTRAYDFGPTRSDSIVDAGWPHDSVLADVVNVIRAFRPHVVISLFSDSSDRDATHRVASRFAREAYSLSALSDADAGRGRRAGWNSQWAVTRLFTLVNGDVTGAGVTRIDVGEFDRALGKSYAEAGAEMRRLQRTQPAVPSPPIGQLWRSLRLDSTRVAGLGLFGGDSGWTRFKGAVSDTVYGAVDSLRVSIDAARRAAARGAGADSVSDALARVVKRVADVRESFTCTSSTVVRCGGPLGDLALSADRIRTQATNALLGAAGVVIDGTVERQLVAVGDSVSTTVTIYNGGDRPLALRRVAVDSRTALVVLARDSTTLFPDSVARWAARLLVRATDLHWWQVHGLLAGTWLHDLPSTSPQIVSGEDRIAGSGTEVTLTIAGVDVPVIQRPLVQRDRAMVRGDNRHPLAGVSALSVLLERTAEFERATIPVDRLFRVFLSSPRSTPETVTVALRVPQGLRVDSTTRVAIIPPFGSQNVFFRLRGTLRPGTDSIHATAQPGKRAPATRSATPAGPSTFELRAFNYGSITHDYPHIPSQQFIRSSKERVESVELHVPPRLRIAYVKGTDDVQSPLGQLQLDVHALEPSLLSVVDLSYYSTILIGAGALANEALAGAVPSLREFMRNGGAVVVLASGDEIARSGLLPFPVAFDSVSRSVNDPSAAIRITDAKSQLLNWPHVITPSDFEHWSSERARSVPSGFDTRYHSLLATGDPGELPSGATLLTAAVGKGVIVYTSLSIDRELNATHPGAARLFVNLLSAGLRPGTTR